MINKKYCAAKEIEYRRLYHEHNRLNRSLEKNPSVNYRRIIHARQDIIFFRMRDLKYLYDVSLTIKR